MSNHKFGRRELLLLSAASALLPQIAMSDDVIDLAWADLLPEGQTALPRSLQGIIEHDSAEQFGQQPVATGVRTDWDGKTVRMPGFIVPLELDGTGVTSFILVPYVGACVHVPPPPANQLVLVTTEKPYQSDGLFESVEVTGMFGTAALKTQLADIGYVISADKVAPY